MGTYITVALPTIIMKLIGKQQLHDFGEKHSDARSQLQSWETEVEAAEWKTPQDVRNRYPKATLPGNLQAIFDICRNKYRLWVQIAYKTGVVLIKKIGTHKEYDKWQIK